MKRPRPAWRIEDKMLEITCPYCGPRCELEFRCGGEAHLERPAEPGQVGETVWADYLFSRANTRGPYAERWVHSHGCGAWFNAVRDTATDRILATYRLNDARPHIGRSENP